MIIKTLQAIYFFKINVIPPSSTPLFSIQKSTFYSTKQQLIGMIILVNTYTVFTQKLIRGPYLQIAAPTQMTVRWRTDVPCIGTVRYGLSQTVLSNVASETAATTEHIVTVKNLTPETKYFYSIAGGQTLLQSGIDNFFNTFPLEGGKKKRRIWVIGDEGLVDDRTRKVARSVENHMLKNGITHTDAWLTLGDNAYSNGSDEAFQMGFFDYYKDSKFMRQTPLFPCLGNHDYCYGDSIQAQCVDNHSLVPFGKIFSLPSAGQAGGKASGKWEYYSFNLGNAHFVCLDSYGEENDKRFWIDEAQRRWMEADLKDAQSNPNIKWIIMYWHHPPYTMGSYSSDNDYELKSIRENLVPVIEKYKVDLILNGHSHVYERSRLLRGHYGKEETFDTTKHLASNRNYGLSSGLYDGSLNSCPFVKNSQSPQNEGTIYVVNGSSAGVWSEIESFPHEVMRAYTPTANKASYNKTKCGSLYLEIEDNRLDAQWIDEDGLIGDQFTMMKDVSKRDTLAVRSGQSITLKPSWIGSYQWSVNNAATPTLQVTPTLKTTYLVRDKELCLRDTFEVRITTRTTDEQEHLYKIFPNPAYEMIYIQDIDFQRYRRVEVFNILGQKIVELPLVQRDMQIDCSDWNAGTYIVKLGESVRKVVIERSE
jgi:hypothetical protein